MGLKTIKLTEEEAKYMEVYVKKQEMAQTAFEEGGRLIRKTGEDLWDALFKLYPEVDTKGKEYISKAKLPIFNHKEMVIRYFEKE